MNNSRIKVSTVAQICLRYDSDMSSDDKRIVLVNTFYQPGRDSFRAEKSEVNDDQFDMAIVLDNAIDSFFFSLIMNGFIFRSTARENGVQDKPKKITVKSIKDYYMPFLDYPHQAKLGCVERLIEFLDRKHENNIPMSFMDYLKDLRDSICLELYMPSFFNKLGVSVIEEVYKVTEEKMDFTEIKGILTLAKNLAEPESVVRMKVREMNVVMSHFFKNLKELLTNNDLESK